MPSAQYETPGFRFADPAVRHAREGDIPHLIALFQQSYGSSYPYPELSDPEWIRRTIYGDAYVWLVIEEAGELLACGALRLDTGDHDDHLGEMGRIVVHPGHAGRGVGRRMIAALLDAADDLLEFVYGDARTQHRFMQALVEGAGFHPLGFLPQRFVVCGRRESMIVYGRLLGMGARLRRAAPPRLVPGLLPLAAHVLASMSLPCPVQAVDAAPYERLHLTLVPRPLDREARAALIRMGPFPAREPAVFGPLSLDRGVFHLARRKACYTVYRDEGGRVVGALGSQFDPVNGLLHVLELIAADDGVRREMCEAIVREAGRVQAAAVELNVSAYEPRLQATLVDLGFVPAAYQPAMVFHAGERLDTVRMLRPGLSCGGEVPDLTGAARSVHAIVQASLLAAAVC